MSNTSNEQYYRYRKIAIRIRELIEEGRMSSDSQMSVLKIAKLPGEDANVVAEAPSRHCEVLPRHCEERSNLARS